MQPREPHQIPIGYQFNFTQGFKNLFRVVKSKKQMNS